MIFSVFMEKSIPEGFGKVQQILLSHYLLKLIVNFDIALCLWACVIEVGFFCFSFYWPMIL